MRNKSSLLTSCKIIAWFLPGQDWVKIKLWLALSAPIYKAAITVGIFFFWVLAVHIQLGF